VAAEEGPLVLADISGYTAFVADAEIEHSRAILNELLELLVRGIARHLRIGQIEGDAVFGVGKGMPPHPVEWLEECFVQYQRRLRDIAEITTCPCRACANVGALTLKFVAHHGEYMSQRFGNKETFVGRDVNLVHRLLKNTVPSHEYLLASSAFLERLPTSARAGFVAHSERYDLGEITGAYIDLAALREQARSETTRRLVDSDHARLTLRRRYQTTHERLWQVLTAPDERQRWMARKPKRIDYHPGVRGTMLGSEYHCEHRLDRVVFRVVSAVVPDQLTMVYRTPLALVWETDRVRETDDASLELVRSFHWEGAPGLKGRLADWLQGMIIRTFEARTMNTIGALAATERSPTTEIRMPPNDAGEGAGPNQRNSG
jgi:class 3 adenylate cyclase